MKSITRREFLVAGTGSLAQLAYAKEKRGFTKPASKKRRLLFNWDGSVIHTWGRTVLPASYGPLTREQFTSLVFTPIENTGVDTVLFSFGSGNVAEYQSTVLEWPGEADRFEFPESKTWYGGVEVDPKDQYLNPKSLADAGHNPPAVIVEECHKRGLDAFVSLRMNDIHDGQHPKGTLPNPELPAFKRINPDWLVDDLDWWTALDFEHPKVRALKLRVVEEFFDRWDFDGIELDWLRHSLYFRRGTERENSKCLTLLMRDIRKSLQARAAKRGRPIEIAVRIPERVPWCQEGGFEIDKWIAEDLVDMLILGQGLTEAPGLSEFRELMKARKLPIYPSLFCYGNGYRISPDEVIRGSAANLWKDGADGLYTFNWFLYGSWRKHLLNEIADPKLLRNKDKHYTLVQRFDSNARGPGSDYVRYNTVSKEAPVPFDLTEMEPEHAVFVSLADDFKTSPPKNVELWIVVDYSQPGDRLALSVGDTQLEPAEIGIASNWQNLGMQISPLPGNGMIGFPSSKPFDMRFQALRLPVPPKALKLGRNKLLFKLHKRGPGSDKPLQVRRVELVTRMGAGRQVS
ncbi:MAG: hypothetical protein FJW26_03780 [Acidimicrobiia bacterium]|nr:hypothetical protein [Acidimicrobiia bacterium]